MKKLSLSETSSEAIKRSERKNVKLPQKKKKNRNTKKCNEKIVKFKSKKQKKFLLSKEHKL